MESLVNFREALIMASGTKLFAFAIEWFLYEAEVDGILLCKFAVS